MHCSVISVPVEDKLPEGCTPRFLDQEGIFTGRKLQVSDKNQAIIENRLLRQQSRASDNRQVPKCCSSCTLP